MPAALGRGGTLRLVTFSLSGPPAVSPEYALAATEHAVGILRGGRLAYVFTAKLATDALVLGLYQSLPDEAGGLGVYRRITGGDMALVRAGDIYTSIVWPAGSLAEAVERARLAAECGGVKVWAATLVDGVGVAEFYGSSLADCITNLYGEPYSRLTLPLRVLERKARQHLSPTWRLYRIPARTGIRVWRVSRGSYYAEVAVETFEEYIAGVWLNANFMAAPPMEPFNILETLKGTRLDELILANIEVALSSRLELYGLTWRDLLELLRRVHEAIGAKYYSKTD